jgi:carbamoyl-phosphate synthase large subunit
MGMAADFPTAFLKAQEGAGSIVPVKGRAFISVQGDDKEAAVPIARALADIGFEIVATTGTRTALRAGGVEAELVYKVTDGERPHIVDLMEKDEIDFVLNTTSGKQSKLDSYSIRRTALLRNIFYCTTLPAAHAATQAMQSLREGKSTVRSLQEYHGGSAHVAEKV